MTKFVFSLYFLKENFEHFPAIPEPKDSRERFREPVAEGIKQHKHDPKMIQLISSFDVLSTMKNLKTF